MEEDFNPAKIGKQIDYILQLRGISKKELARAIHISDSAIVNYTSGARTPDLMKIRQMAAYLQVSTDYLLGNEADGYTTQEKLLIDVYRSIPKELQSKAIPLLRALCDPPRKR